MKPISPLATLMLEVDRHRLGRHHGPRIREAHERHEVPLQRALMLRRPSRQRLEPGHMRPMAERNAPQIVLHLRDDSVRKPSAFWGQFTNMEPYRCTQTILRTPIRRLVDSRNLEHRQRNFVSSVVLSREGSAKEG